MTYSPKNRLRRQLMRGKSNVQKNLKVYRV
jgi:hypothetical protein